MADRTVRVELKADISDYTSGLAKAAAETRALGGNVDKQFKATTKTAKKRGEEAGGALSQGIQLGLVRNSPLIAAGIGGALAAGAPAVLAGAGVMFAGLGAVFAAQTQEVAAQAIALGDALQQGLQEDAAVLVPNLVASLRTLGDTFEEIRPQLRDAFAASAPIFETLTSSISNAITTLMPALTRAVQAAGPTFEGLGHIIEELAGGLAGMFDNISEHGAAAGQAFSAIGDILGAVLPVLGELLGQGVELASAVLPPLASALGLVASALEAIAPALPVLVAGFAALKGAQAVGGVLGRASDSLATFAQNAAFASYEVDGFAGRSAGKASSAVRGLGRATADMGEGMGRAAAAMPALGIVLGGIASDLSDAEQEEQKWAAAILAGGDAAAAAQSEYDASTHWGQSIDEATGLASSWEDAKEQAGELAAQMGPLGVAQLVAQQAQKELNTAIAEHGVGSDQATAAAGRYATAQAEVERISSAAELAISGVTQAMINQANQALAAADSQFGYQNAQLAVTQAQSNLNDVLADGKSTAADVQDAELQLSQAMLTQATAAGQAAQDASGLGDSLEGQKVASQAALQELYALRTEMGDRFPPALESAIRGLERSGAATGGVNANAQIAFGSIRNLTGGLINLGGQHPNPTISATDRATPTIRGVGDLLAGIHDKSVTLTVNASVAAARASIASLGAGLLGGHAAGGYIAGPGSGTSDSIPARLSNGEYVVRAASVQQYGVGLLNAINSQQFAAGGYVRANDVSSSVWDTLLAAGWKGRAGDRMEALYAPAREFSAAGTGGAPITVKITGAKISGTLDLGDGITGRIDGRIDRAFTDLANQQLYTNG